MSHHHSQMLNVKNLTANKQANVGELTTIHFYRNLSCEDYS